MDKNTRQINEVVNGRTTSKSFKTYSNLRNPRGVFSFRSTIIILSLIILVTASVFVFFNSIKTAYFNKVEQTEEVNTNITRIKSKFDMNDAIKVENVTKKISDVFGIPVGVKVIEISEDSFASSLLKVNDIIVKVSGEDITNIKQLNSIIENSSDDEYLTYTVYRNGIYCEIDPFFNEAE